MRECIYAGFIRTLSHLRGLWKDVIESVSAGREYTEIPLKMRSCHTLRKKHRMIRTQTKTNIIKYSILTGCSQYADF